MSEGIFYKVNEYITLILEDGKSNIYVRGELFRICKQLLLNIPKSKINTYDDIDSIDEAAEVYNSTEQKLDVTFTPEQEFWAHCSNLQIWVESGYDARLLHSNLAFPLLKELAEIGDPKAKKVFKDEIAKRIESRSPSVIYFLLEENYLQYLTQEERETLFQMYRKKYEISKDLRILGEFARSKVHLAKKLLAKLIKTIVAREIPSELNSLLKWNYYDILSREEQETLFQTYMNRSTSEKDLHFLYKLARVGIQPAMEALEEEIWKIINTHHRPTASPSIKEPFSPESSNFNLVKSDISKLLEEIMQSIRNIGIDRSVANKNSKKKFYFDFWLRLLRKLTWKGYFQAKITLKKEIVKLIQTGNGDFIGELNYSHYLDFLTKEEMVSVFDYLNRRIRKHCKQGAMTHDDLYLLVELTEAGDYWAKSFLNYIKPAVEGHLQKIVSPPGPHWKGKSMVFLKYFVIHFPDD